MAPVISTRPITTGRRGYLTIYSRNGFPLNQVWVTISSIHVYLHWERQKKRPIPPQYILCEIDGMEDGGPIPLVEDFQSGAYAGTLDLQGRLWINLNVKEEDIMPQSFTGSTRPLLSPMQNTQLRFIGGPEAEIGPVKDKALPPPQPRSESLPGQTVETAILIEDENTAFQAPIQALEEVIPMPCSLQLSQTLQEPITIPESPPPQPIQAAEEPNPRAVSPPPPCHLKERLNHLSRYVAQNKANASDMVSWLNDMRSSRHAQRQWYCELFWFSNEQAKIDLEWVTRHFLTFTEAHMERRAIEARKLSEGLVWEDIKEECEASWRKKRTEKQRAARLEKLGLGGKKDTANEASRMTANENPRVTRQGAKRETAETKAAEQEKKREFAAKKREEEKEANREDASPEKKRKANPESTEASKKRKTNAQLPTPAPSEKSISEREDGEGSDEDAQGETDEEWEISEEDHHHGIQGTFEEDADGEEDGERGEEESDDDEDGIGAAIRAVFDNDEDAEGEEEEVDDDDDGLRDAIMAGFNNMEEIPPSLVQEPEEESDEGLVSQFEDESSEESEEE